MKKAPMDDADRQMAKESFRHMTPKEKIAYFLQYYGVKTIIAAVLVICLISIIGHATFNKETPKSLGIAINAEFLDVDKVADLAENLDEEYPQYNDGGKKEFKSYMFYNGYTQAEQEEKSTTITRFAAQIQAGMLDLVFGDEKSLTEQVERSCLLSLDEVFSEEELAMIREKADAKSEDGKSGLVDIKYDIVNDNGRTERTESGTYLICVTGGDPYIDECLLNKEVYVGVIVNTDSREEVRCFIFSLLDIPYERQDESVDSLSD